MANMQRVEDVTKHVKMLGNVVENTASTTAIVDVGVAASLPSFFTASELLSAPYSCLVMSTHRRHIALSPLHLNKKNTGIRQELDAELLRFSPSLGGVPLAYDGIRIVRKQGDIFDDSGYIHLNIEANFIVFQPKTGQTLLGKVNKLGANHVGCLVHGCFNASIPKPNRVSMETWRDAGPQIGTELEFNVTALDADTVGVLLIRGLLTRTRVQELLAIGDTMASSVQFTIQQPDEPNANQTTESMEVSEEERPKKKKKNQIQEEAPCTPDMNMVMDTTLELNGTLSESNGRTEKKKKKAKINDTAMDTSPEFNGTMDETNGHVEKKKKKKKKKKDKHTKEEPQEEELSSIEVHGSDSSGYFSDKPSKKRKSQAQSQEAYMPIKKKIKTEKK